MIPDDSGRRASHESDPYSSDPLLRDPRIAPLLRALDVLSAVARHLDPSVLALLGPALDTPEDALRRVSVDAPESATPADAARPGPGDPVGGDPVAGAPVSGDQTNRLVDPGRTLDTACRIVLTACEDLRAACLHDDLRAAYRALRRVAAAEELVYPLSEQDAAVSRHFLPTPLRDDATVRARMHTCAPTQPGRTGILHVSSIRGTRGGLSMYVPEHYDPGRRWPLVVALHGGGGHGRDFLWQWLKDARAHGAIVVAPTSSGRTWPIQDEDADAPRLSEVVDDVRARWSIDPTRILLTGMSDGGTFAYLAGLQTDAPFTHLAPLSAAFHPILAEVAEPARLRGLPMYVVHGVLDWMFPVSMARTAAAVLSAAGAAVRYCEVPDLGHCYPVELNAGILDWLQSSPQGRAGPQQ